MNSIYDSMFSGASGSTKSSKTNKDIKKKEAQKKEAEMKLAFLKDAFSKDSDAKEKGISYDEWLKTLNGLNAQKQYSYSDSKLKRVLNSVKDSAVLTAQVLQERKQATEDSLKSEEEEKSANKKGKFTWIIGGSLVLLAGGVVAYFALKNKGLKPKGKIK